MIYFTMELWKVLLISFFIISVFGTLFHFTHDWFKKGILLHIFSAVNESTWEHMKLLLAPTLIAMVFQFFVFKGAYFNFWNAVLCLLVVELIAMPLLFEPLRLIMKKVPLWLTIVIFFLSIVIGIFIEYLVLTKEFLLFGEVIAMVLVVVIILLFAVFSYYPPKFFIFKDPISGKYGDYTHKD